MSSPHAITQPAFRPSVMGQNGVVTSGHHLASHAGIQIMMAGGNAIDAAIATAAALGVVEPQSSGAGGDGFMLIYSAKTGKVSAVNATGAAPTGATREFYLKHNGIPMKGILSVSIPGLVDGWLVAHERFGSLPLDQVFAPAIALCEDGFPLSHQLANSLPYAQLPVKDAVHTTKERSPKPSLLLPNHEMVCSQKMISKAITPK
jgi:gamma-glutamyltranspeptidase / glutathione hydrolase